MTTTQSASAFGIAGKVRPKLIPNFDAPTQEALAPFAEDDTSPLIRREMFDGRVHTVVPAVLAVAGVLNDALVSAEELARSADAWNGRDVPILHPEDFGGNPISVADSPRVLERAVGRVLNARMDGDKLRAELWLDEQKVDRLGHSDMLAGMMQGGIVEVSTGYIADDVLETGEFRGRPYSVRHVNIRPDHLALLPGQIGACSIADGCGAPRINRRGLKVKVNEALETIAQALGVRHRNNCNCEACAMKTLEQRRKEIGGQLTKLKLISNAAFVVATDAALGVKANEGLGAKHLKMLEDLDERGLDMMSAMIEAYRSAGAKQQADDEPPANPDDEDPNAMRKQNRNANQPITITTGELNTLIANAVAKAVATQIPEQSRRLEVSAKLKANEANPFSDEELSTLPVETLERVEQKLRPVDYSGAGGFAANYRRDEGDDAPLRINRGVLIDPPKKDAA